MVKKKVMKKKAKVVKEVNPNIGVNQPKGENIGSQCAKITE